MQENEMKELLAGAQFKYAKSMPRFPHHYTLRETWHNDPLFDAVVQFIRDHGVRRKFYSREYIYYDFDGHTYWTMGDPVPETILINRAERRV